MLNVDEGTSFITAGSCIGGDGLKPKLLAPKYTQPRVSSRATGELGVSSMSPSSHSRAGGSWDV